MKPQSQDTTGSPGGSFNFPYDGSASSEDEKKFYQYVRGDQPLPDELKRIIDVGVPASVRSTWPVVNLDGGEDEAAKDPEYAAEHFHKYWTPKIQAHTNKAVAEALERVEREAPKDMPIPANHPTYNTGLGYNRANASWRETLSKIKQEYLIKINPVHKEEEDT